MTNGRCRIGSTQDRRQTPSGVVAALLAAAGATIWIIRVLPIHFTYDPNDLGIISLTTVTAYPTQQETFWLLFAVAVGARVGERQRDGPHRQLAASGGLQRVDLFEDLTIPLDLRKRLAKIADHKIAQRFTERRLPDRHALFVVDGERHIQIWLNDDRGAGRGGAVG